MDTLVPAGPNRPLGSAVFADRETVEQRYPYSDGKIWIGRSASSAPIGYNDDRHICLVSGSRGGKGASFIINNLCLWPGSVVVIDPKGEDASVTAARRGDGSSICEGMGQRVHVLDPFGVARVDATYRSRFNPFDALKADDPRTIDEAARLADALVVVNRDAREPFWDESARSMVRGLILHVLTAPRFEGRRNLITLRQLIMRGEWEMVESLERQGVEDIQSAQGLLWMSLARNPAFRGLVASIGDSLLNLLANEPKVFEGVRQVAERNTEFLDSPAMQDCVASSNFELSEIKTDPRGRSVYLCLPPMYMSTHHRWLRMMLSLIIDEMQMVPGQPKSGHRVLMLLDEFAGLERLTTIEKAVAQIAGYGVKLCFVLQSLEQLKGTYKDGWETFLANSGLQVFFSVNDDFTRQHVSKLVGDTEVIRTNRSGSDTRTDSEGSSEGSSEGKNQSTTRGQSSSSGWNESTGESESTSENNSTSSSSGTSRGDSRRPGVLSTADHFSSGETWSSSHSYSTGKSRSTSKTRGNSGSSSGSSGSSDGTTTGTTRGTSRGTSRGHTDGFSDAVHRRPLLAPHEVGEFLARVDDKDSSLFPGLALALVAGQPPIVVRRINYFEDYQFVALFEAHPDHGAPPLFRTALDQAELNRLCTVLHYTVGWDQVPRGTLVAQGERIATGVVDDVLGSGTARRFNILASRSGRITAPQQWSHGGMPFDCDLFHYDGQSAMDPFGELRRLVNEVQEALRGRAAEEEAARAAQLAAEAQEREYLRQAALAARAGIVVPGIVDEILRERGYGFDEWFVWTALVGSFIAGSLAFGAATGIYPPEGVMFSALATAGFCCLRVGWQLRKRYVSVCEVRSRLGWTEPDLVPFVRRRDMRTPSLLVCLRKAAGQSFGLTRP